MEQDLYCGLPDSGAHVLCFVPHTWNAGKMEGRGEQDLEEGQ